jgi:hypothetical protein
MNACFPSAEEGLRLHLLLLGMAPDASADVCEAYLGPLLHWLAGKAPAVDPDLRQTAAHEALIKYFNNPTSYDPGRASLATYLRMAARGDLWNLLRGEARHHLHRVTWSVVEDDEEGGNLSGREEEPVLRLEREEETAQGQAFLRAVEARCTEAERGVLELLLAGERQTSAYAAALGVGGLPVAEQEREVKRVKGRLKKRLERGGLKHD